MINSISQYIQTVDKIYQTGETTEHSFRGALETLLNTFLPKPKKIAFLFRLSMNLSARNTELLISSCVKETLLFLLLKQKICLIRI